MPKTNFNQENKYHVEWDYRDDICLNGLLVISSISRRNIMKDSQEA